MTETNEEVGTKAIPDRAGRTLRAGLGPEH